MSISVLPIIPALPDAILGSATPPGSSAGTASPFAALIAELAQTGTALPVAPDAQSLLPMPLNTGNLVNSADKNPGTDAVSEAEANPALPSPAPFTPIIVPPPISLAAVPIVTPAAIQAAYDDATELASLGAPPAIDTGFPAPMYFPVPALLIAGPPAADPAPAPAPLIADPITAPASFVADVLPAQVSPLPAEPLAVQATAFPNGAFAPPSYDGAALAVQKAQEPVDVDGLTLGFSPPAFSKNPDIGLDIAPQASGAAPQPSLSALGKNPNTAPDVAPQVSDAATQPSLSALGKNPNTAPDVAPQVSDAAPQPSLSALGKNPNTAPDVAPQVSGAALQPSLPSPELVSESPVPPRASASASASVPDNAKAPAPSANIDTPVLFSTLVSTQILAGAAPHSVNTPAPIAPNETTQPVTPAEGPIASAPEIVASLVPVPAIPSQNASALPANFSEPALQSASSDALALSTPGTPSAPAPVARDARPIPAPQSGAAFQPENSEMPPVEPVTPGKAANSLSGTRDDAEAALPSTPKNPALTQTAPVQRADTAANAAAPPAAPTPANLSLPQPMTNSLAVPASLFQATATPDAPVRITELTGGLPNLDALAVRIAHRAIAGDSRFEIRLDPPELGRIEVRLDVDRHGHVQTQLSAERPQTLELLQRDAPALERALKDAGLDSNGLSFSLKGEGRQAQGEDSGAARLYAQNGVQNDIEQMTPELAGFPSGQLWGADTRLDIRV